MRVYFWAVAFVPLDYMSVFMPVPYCFDYFSFAIYLEIRNCDTLAFSMFQGCFGYSGVSKQILGFFSYFCKKWSLNFDKDCIESIYGFFSVGILTIQFFQSIITEYISIYLCFLQFLLSKSCSVQIHLHLLGYIYSWLNIFFLYYFIHLSFW